MNSVLTKCITELKSEKPRIEYVLGMLETLAEMQTPTQTPFALLAQQANAAAQNVRITADEELSPEAKAYLHGGTGTVTN